MKLSNAYYPFLFAAFPVLFLWSHNISEASLGETIAPLILTEAVVALCMVIVKRFLKSGHRAELLVTVAIVWFFSYGHVLNIFEKTFLARVLSAHQFIVLFLWTLFWGLASYICLKYISHPKRYTPVLNYTALVLCMSVTFPAIIFFLSPRHIVSPVVLPHTASLFANQPYPDIYYIILDGHARSDILHDIYGADNTVFIKHLLNKGFYVADQSHSNYSFTNLSLGSSLNLDYIPDDIIEIGKQRASDLAPVIEHLRHNKLVQTLKQAGYQIVSFDSEVSLTALKDIDSTLRPIWALSELQNSLLATTIVPEFILSATYLLGSHYDIQYALHRSRIMFIFNQLGALASQQREQPRFIFAHIIAPHAPFVFDANGNSTEPKRPFSFLEEARYFIRLEGVEQYRSQYREQLAFIDRMTVNAINDILKYSTRPPVIVIQSDHGPASALGPRAPYDLSLNEQPLLDTYLRERMSILNAYYFPNKAYERLYPTITPVNSFRIILDQYLGMQYPLLPDRSLFSSWEYPYQFQDVTQRLIRPTVQ